MQPGKNISLFNGLHGWLEAEPPRITIALFKSAIYGFLLLNTLFLLPVSRELWSADGWIHPLATPPTLWYRLIYLLMDGTLNSWYPALIIFQVSGIALWFAKRWRIFASGIIYISTLILFARAHLYITGGHTLLVMFLFYFIFMPDGKTSLQSNVLNNLFLLACKLQLVVVYLFAGLYKLQGTYWLSGDAVYYVLHIREFSHPWLIEVFGESQTLGRMATWFALGYQLIFPVLVWFRKTKGPLLFAGAFFHLYVAFGMGLPDFGIIMVLSYLMFLPDGFYQGFTNSALLKRGKALIRS
ncbi:MAG: hypothetical protein EA392_07690 [Cryomorphaceae bacterium]|nr:MAG: hypothetical protein EA392_07690 [Cryomorphaceae bacterium]